MAAVASNLSLIPALLHVSRLKIITAAAFSRKSEHGHRAEVNEEYEMLIQNMDDLGYVTRDFNLDVADLSRDFKIQLSSTLSQFKDMRPRADFGNSVHVKVSTACALWLGARIPWLPDSNFHRHNLGPCTACGTTIMATFIVHGCLRQPAPRFSESFCAPWIRNLPGIEQYLDEVADDRVKAVRKLGHFLERLHSHVRSLLDMSRKGKDLCEMVERNLQNIASYNHEDDRSIKTQLKVMEKQKWHLSSWLEWLRNSTGMYEKQASLQVVHNDPTRTMELQDFAFHLFEGSKSVLYNWSSIIQGIYRSLKTFEASADQGWQGAWQNWQPWDELQAELETLWPIVDALEMAHRKLRARSSDSGDCWKKAGEYCAQKARSFRGGHGITFDWEECYRVLTLSIVEANSF
ncbi:hypothetical protein ONS96_011863 [Cadophora gregata f. sp. sojae]|nr:hypothetical protein ONS96_011863 [Cadophora gregata f. sp. sojae]